MRLRKKNRLLSLLSIFFLVAATISSGAFACITVSVSSSDLDFDTYNPYDSMSTASTFYITVECVTDDLIPPLATPFTVGIESVSNPGSANKVMQNQNSNLNYSITKSSSSTEWGPVGTPGAVSAAFADILDPPPIDLIGQGKIFPQQDVSVGSYSDQLILTVEF